MIDQNWLSQQAQEHEELQRQLRASVAEQIRAESIRYRPKQDHASVLHRVNAVLIQIDHDIHMLNSELAIEQKKAKARFKLEGGGYHEPKMREHTLVTQDRLFSGKHGRLTVEYKFRFDGDVDDITLIRHDGKYKCRCDCGGIKYARGQALLAGKVTSCGCVQRERSENNRIRREREAANKSKRKAGLTLEFVAAFHKRMSAAISDKPESEKAAETAHTNSTSTQPRTRDSPADSTVGESD